MTDIRRDIGFWTAVSLVIGGMVGSGVFSLPAALARFGGLSVLAWVIGALGSVAVAQAKAESAVKFKRPTKVFEDALAAGGLGLRLLATEAVCPLEGGLPLMRAGQLIGAIGVSGMQSTQDARAAAAGARAVTDGE